MLNDNILDTVAMSNSDIVYKNYHADRTIEAYHFLGTAETGFAAAVRDCYNTIEQNHAGKISSQECLRIVFSAAHPLQFQTEVRKLEVLSSEIALSVVLLSERPSPAAAFKWANRKKWEVLLHSKAPQAEDILTVGPNQELIETSRFNVFCYEPESHQMFTPKLESGCVNGVLRRAALDAGIFPVADLGQIRVSEKQITLDNVAKYTLFVGNSVRGLLPAKLIELF